MLGAELIIDGGMASFRGTRSKTCTQVDANPGSAACSDAMSGSRQKRGARIPRVGGHCRNVARARAITTHGFGLWAVDGKPEVGFPEATANSV